MLLSLYIENYALIEKQTIEFADGFNVITGETGAGKSIIVNALSLIMGERASADLIKSGKQRAILEAVFEVKTQKLAGYEDEDVLIVTREISLNGRNLIKVNGRTITQAELKNLTKYLLDIHGQHQHQLLIDPENHLEILDLFSPDNLLSEVRQEFQDYQTAKKEYDLLRQSKDLRQEEKDFLKFQLEELVAAAPAKGEYAELLEEKNRLDSYTEIADAVNKIKDSLYQTRDNLHQNKGLLFSLAEKEARLKELSEQAENLDILFEEFKLNLKDYADKLEYNPQRLDTINERLEAYAKLKRKHLKKVIEDTADIGELLLQKQKELNDLFNNLEFSDERLKELENKLALAEKKYLSISQKLSQERKTQAKELSTKIVKSLQDLKMKSVQFEVYFQTKKEYAEAGLDTIEFLISPNPGEPLKPLVKIASGGELSRIMLAIKSILIDKDRTSSMIFDEIDTGIGGDTANAIAAKISSIARKHQVICITHLAQIAAVADQHILVHKGVTGGKTQVNINNLAKPEREAEIARMLSGKITETTKAHAKELLGVK